MYIQEKNPYLPLLRLSLVLFLLILLSFAVSAQKNTNKARSTALKQIFKDDKLAAYSYSSAYSFEIKNENLQVSHTDDIGMISLEGNVQASREIYYNDHVSINSGEVEYANGKTILTPKTCGSYEVEDIFYSDAKVCSYKLNFLYEGTETIFKSKSLYDDPRYLTKVFFHDELPVAERTITFSIPATATVELVERNFTGFDIQKKITQQPNAKVHTYTIKNIKAMKSEANSLGMLYYYPHIIVVTKNFTSGTGKKTVISSTDDLYQWYATIVKGVKNDQSVFKDEVSKLTASAKTSEEKIRSIYYWVQDNIKYIAFEDGIAGFKPEAAQNVYLNRYGDCKGMANLTKEMLKAAGFDARLTWIGTNRIPYNYELPSLAVDNHMICTVNLGDKQYILDPTEKFIALGKHGERIQGKEMLIENGDQYIVKKVPVSNADQNLIVRNESITLEGDILKGQGQIVIHGEAMKNILYFSTNMKQDDRKKVFDNLVVADYTNVDKVEVTNTPPIDRDKAMEVKYTYGLSNKVTRFDNDLYVDIDWNKTYKNLKMEEDRESDYYFNRKINTKVVKKLKVPAGYKVTHLPPNLLKTHNDFSISVNFKQEGEDLLYTNEIIVKNGLIKKADFTAWNTAIKELNDVYNDQIVLTKKK
jgi:transglutaminase-like putative cysteine protease